MKFSCEECIFTVTDVDGIQIPDGCEANRLEKLGGLPIGSQSYYPLLRFCNLKRTPEWLNYYIFNDKDPNHDRRNPLKAAREEIKPSIRCAILYEPKHTIGQLKHTLQSLINTNYNKLEVVVIERKSEGLAITETINLCKTQLLESDIKWTVDQCINYTASLERQTYKALKKDKIGYYTVIEAGLSIKQKYFENLNDLLNVECEPILFVTPDDDKILFTVQSFLYRMLQPDSFTKLKEVLHNAVQNQNIDNHPKP